MKRCQSRSGLEKRLSVESLISEVAKPVSVLDRLRDQFVHFVCYGTLEAKKPFEARFEPHGNERLTLLDGHAISASWYQIRLPVSLSRD